MQYKISASYNTVVYGIIEHCLPQAIQCFPAWLGRYHRPVTPHLTIDRMLRRKKKIIVGKRRLGEDRISQLAPKPTLDSTRVLSIARVKLGYNTEYTRKNRYTLGTICRAGILRIGATHL